MDKVSDIGHPYFHNFASLSALYVSGTVFVVRKADKITRAFGLKLKMTFPGFYITGFACKIGLRSKM